MKRSLASIWTCALKKELPRTLIASQGIRRTLPKDASFLFWGKAARATADSVPSHGLRLVLSPEDGEHPLPGPGSFNSGRRLLEFLANLGRRGGRDLVIFLSGGASSLAWLRPSGLDEEELLRRLRALQRRPVTIQELNRERARLDLLKDGGAARLLRRFAPEVRAKVYVISDVAPFGAETVGSGPFRGLPHFVLTDNASFVEAAKECARGERILDARHSQLGTEVHWAKQLTRLARVALSHGESGVVIWGGEPQVKLRSDAGHGGRQTQLAARLVLAFWNEIRDGKIEVLCGTSDGRDGNSGAAAVHLHRRSVSRLSPALQRQLKKAIQINDTATVIRKCGFLIPAYATGTNVQDLVLLRVQS